MLELIEDIVTSVRSASTQRSSSTSSLKASLASNWQLPLKLGFGFGLGLGEQQQQHQQQLIVCRIISLIMIINEHIDNAGVLPH